MKQIQDSYDISAQEAIKRVTACKEVYVDFNTGDDAYTVRALKGSVIDMLGECSSKSRFNILNHYSNLPNGLYIVLTRAN